MEQVNYQQLVKEVFGNDKGEQLLNLWQVLYGDRLSYVPGIEIVEAQQREGERKFFQDIKAIMES